ncbi:MAG: tetraacyldisaccharide 4'-kinase [Polyangiaceae bacterium]
MLAVQDALEKGRFGGPLSRSLGSAWACVAALRLEKSLIVPPGVKLVTVGGVTLGGSGKTPFAVAYAKRESEAGKKVAIVGHAHRARPLRARVVESNDDVFAVGDEALACAIELAGAADIVVAPHRQAAIDLALERGAEVLVLDGVHQTSPRRADLAVLVIDAAARMTDACPPAGDLRAPLAAMCLLADVVVEIGDDELAEVRIPGSLRALVVSDGASAPDGALLTYELLRTRVLGLAISVAHQERITSRLARKGVVPALTVGVADHRGHDLRHRLERTCRSHSDIDAWLTTSKCGAFVCSRAKRSSPICVIRHAVSLPPALP